MTRYKLTLSTESGDRLGEWLLSTNPLDKNASHLIPFRDEGISLVADDINEAIRAPEHTAFIERLVKSLNELAE